MTTPPPPLSDNRDKPKRCIEWNTWVAWLVILGSVGFIVRGNWLRLTGGRPPIADVDPAELRSFNLELAARYALGAKLSLPGNVHDANTAFMLQLREQVHSQLDQLRLLPLVGEFEGKEAASRQIMKEKLNSLDQSQVPANYQRDLRTLTAIYDMGPQNVDAADRDGLIKRHGWFARVALTYGLPESDPQRQAVVRSAKLAFFADLTVFLGVAVALLAGVILLILVAIQWSRGRMRRAYPYRGLPPNGPYAATPQPIYPPAGWYPPVLAYMPQGGPPLLHFPPPPPGLVPPIADSRRASRAQQTSATSDGASDPAPIPVTRTGPFLEAFAFYLSSYIGLGYLIHRFVREPSIAWSLLAVVLLPVAFLWPLWRGVTWRELRRGLGWHKGRGLFREIGTGIVAYIAGLPLMVAGIVVSYLIMRRTHLIVEHPIQHEIGRNFWENVSIYVMACVWAPIVEETMFRGAFFHHLRGRRPWWIAAGVTSLAFAAIHPQGPAGIPMLATLAMVFCVMREWRGSILPSMTAHALNNGVVVTVLIVVLGGG